MRALTRGLVGLSFPVLAGLAPALAAESDTLPEFDVEAWRAHCAEIRERLEDPDPERRLAVLEEMAGGSLDLGGCTEAADALLRMLDEERDAFVLYRTMQAVERQLHQPSHILAFLDQPSADVRRRAAEVLRGQTLEREQEEKMLAAMRQERDPWTRLAMASVGLETHSAERIAVLSELIREGGPTAGPALLAWTYTDGDVRPVLEVLERPGPLRSPVLFILSQRGGEPRVREALLRVLRTGSIEEGTLAAYGLISDPGAGSAPEWLEFVLDPRIQISSRVSLALRAEREEPWKLVASQAMRTDPALSEAVEAVSSGQATRAELAVPGWNLLWPSRPRGTLAPKDQATVRCATRPAGSPLAGVSRLPAGVPFSTEESFTQEGAVWLREHACWVREDVLNTTSPPETSWPTDLLEADVPAEILGALGGALATHALETFDPIAGFTGIRLRDASQEFQARWRSGQEGVLQVLAAVEANALLRESLEAQNR